MATNSSAFQIRRARASQDGEGSAIRFGHPIVLLSVTTMALVVVDSS